MKLNPRPTMDHQGYQIMSCPLGQRLADVCAQFQYKGFTVSFSTSGYADGGCCNEVQYWRETSGGTNLAYSVEEAINKIDEYHKKQIDLDSIN